MQVKYLGHSAFLFSGSSTVVTDPFSGIGYEMERVSADYCLCSHDHFDHNAQDSVCAKVVIKQKADEKKAKDISLQVIQSYHDEAHGAKRGNNNIYKFVIDGITICHMGDFGEIVKSDLKERVGKVDVLLLPVGGVYTIDALSAKSAIDFLQPKIVIPMHYSTKRSNIKVASVNKFLSVCGYDVERKPNCFQIDIKSATEKTVIYLPDFSAF